MQVFRCPAAALPRPLAARTLQQTGARKGVRVFFMLCSVLPACAGRCGAPISHRRVCAPLAIPNTVFDYSVLVCILTFMSQNVWPTGPNIVIGLVKCAPMARRGLSLASHGVPACLRPWMHGQIRASLYVDALQIRNMQICAHLQICM